MSEIEALTNDRIDRLIRGLEDETGEVFLEEIGDAGDVGDYLYSALVGLKALEAENERLRASLIPRGEALLQIASLSEGRRGRCISEIHRIATAPISYGPEPEIPSFVREGFGGTAPPEMVCRCSRWPRAHLKTEECGYKSNQTLVIEGTAPGDRWIFVGDFDSYPAMQAWIRLNSPASLRLQTYFSLEGAEE